MTTNQDAVRLADNLTRYHNVVDALLSGGDGSDNGRSALANLRTWKKTAEGHPPHIVAGERLAMEIQDDLGLVLDAKADLATVWKPEFDDLRERLCRLTKRYGQDGHDTSLGKALMVAQQAARLAERMDAQFRSCSDPPIDEDVAEAAVEDLERPKPDLPDPISNADLKRLAGLKDAEGVTKQIKVATRKSGRSFRKRGAGQSRSYTHGELDAAYQFLNNGKLKNVLRDAGFKIRTKPE